MVTSPRCFHYTTTCLRVRQSPKGKDYVVWDMALELGLPSGTGKLIQLLLDTGTSNCTRFPLPTDGIFPHLTHDNTGVTNELVRTLGQSDKTPPGLPGLKPSSNSVFPVAWITRPTTDLRPSGGFYALHCIVVFHAIIMMSLCVQGRRKVQKSGRAIANRP